MANGGHEARSRGREVGGVHTLTQEPAPGMLVPREQLPEHLWEQQHSPARLRCCARFRPPSPNLPTLPSKSLFPPFATFKMFAFFISGWPVSGPTGLGFNCQIPQFPQQTSPGETQTFEADCNLIQLKW